MDVVPVFSPPMCKMILGSCTSTYSIFGALGCVVRYQTTMLPFTQPPTFSYDIAGKPRCPAQHGVVGRPELRSQLSKFSREGLLPRSPKIASVVDLYNVARRRLPFAHSPSLDRSLCCYPPGVGWSTSRPNDITSSNNGPLDTSPNYFA